MDNRDCKLTITCIQPQEADGDEIYAIVTEADGRATRRPPDKKRFNMSAGDSVTVQSRDPVTITLHENDVLTSDDDLGEVKLEPGVDTEHPVELKTAQYRISARWS